MMGPENQAKRQEAIKAVLKKIESDAGEKLTKKPDVSTLNKALGWDISTSERDQAWKSMKKGTGVENSQSEDEKSQPANPKQMSLADAKKDWPKVCNKMPSPLLIDGVVIPSNGTEPVRDFAKLKKENSTWKMWLEKGLIKEA